MSTTIEEIAAKHIYPSGHRSYSCSAEQRQVFYNFNVKKAEPCKLSQDGLSKGEIRRKLEDRMDEIKRRKDLDWMGMEGEV